jgi:hypothetical protein
MFATATDTWNDFVLTIIVPMGVVLFGFVGWWVYFVRAAEWVDRWPWTSSCSSLFALSAGIIGSPWWTPTRRSRSRTMRGTSRRCCSARIPGVVATGVVENERYAAGTPANTWPQPGTGTEAARTLTIDVALHDWVLTETRRNAADLVTAMKLAFEDIAGALDDYADRLRASPPAAGNRGAGAGAGAGAGMDDEVAHHLRTKGPEITSVVESDIITLVAAIVEACWPDIEREALDALQARVLAETAAGLDVYGRHLDRMGSTPHPRSGKSARAPGTSSESVWQESRGVSGLLQAPVTDPGILQLCAPEHLQLLDVAPSSAKVIRFAPKAAQIPLLGRNTMPSGALGELVWTEWGQVAGVLRLARLRPGTVESILEEG